MNRDLLINDEAFLLIIDFFEYHYYVGYNDLPYVMNDKIHPNDLNRFVNTLVYEGILRDEDGHGVSMIFNLKVQWKKYVLKSGVGWGMIKNSYDRASYWQ